MNPSEQNQRLQSELDSINSMISKVNKEIIKIQTEKQDLQIINFVNRATFSSPLNALFRGHGGIEIFFTSTKIYSKYENER